MDTGDKMDEESLKWELISEKHIIQDKWIDFRQEAYRFPDGKEFEPFYSYSRRNYVVIVASDIDGNYICVKQFRHGIRQVTTEFVAGGIERKDGREYGYPGDSDVAEDPLLAAKRELREETGYESDEWRFLLKVPSNATIADNYAYLYEAKNCRRSFQQDLDDTEYMSVHTYTPDEIEELIASGNFQQSDHVLVWLLSRR